VEDILRTPDVDEDVLRSLYERRHLRSDEEIASMLERVRPVVRKEEKLYYIEPVDPYVPFTWNPKITHEAKNLRRYRVVHTIHAWDRHRWGTPKPTIAEVFSMFPSDAVDNGVIAFETWGPSLSDIDRQGAAMNDGCYVANTILYTAG